MKAVEAVKEKFYCFLGIVHPTYYQSRGWGPWLVQDQAEGELQLWVPKPNAFPNRVMVILIVWIMCLVVVRFPNCIVYSWVYNTQKTVKFNFDCFHSLH